MRYWADIGGLSTDILERLKSVGLNKAELSRILNCGKTRAWTIYTGVSPIRPGEALILCSLLGIDADSYVHEFSDEV